MERSKFHRLFKTTGPAVLPVIHVQSEAQAVRNIQLVISEGAQGVFLINHDFPYTELVPIILNVRERFPYLWLGVNFLGVGGDVAFKILGGLIQTHSCHIDAYWADNAYIDERTPTVQEKADKIQKIRGESGWDGLYFGGTAFKCQRQVPLEYVQKAASIATRYMDIILTSGSGTGISANLQKIINMQKGCDGKTLGLASGVTPENALTYVPYVDCFLVATGISIDFYNLDAVKLRSLISVSRGGGHTYLQTDAWYLNKIAPNTQGDQFAWLDPTSIYIDGKAFADLTSDIICQLGPNVSDIDLIAGLDAMGFPLAAAIATRLNKGLVVIRKSPKLCVDVDVVTYSCYSGSGKKMEIRKDAFKPSTQVLIVDQWIETGGTMKGAIELIERQQGVVFGLVTICMERNEQTLELAKKYRVIHVVPNELQQSFDEHKFLGSQYKN